MAATASTFLLDQSTWDLLLDANGNIAIATAPYQLAQDSASACRTFLGEVYYDTTVGVPNWSILGQTPPLALVKQYYIDETTRRVPGVEAARVFLNTVGKNRILGGQIQVADNSGVFTVAGF